MNNMHEIIGIDCDQRENFIRKWVFEALPQIIPGDDHLICTYFIMTHTSTLAKVAKNIAKNQTTGGGEENPDSLLGKCTANAIEIIPFESSEKIGLIQVAFPIRILMARGDVCYSNDILHIVSGAVQHDLVSSDDLKLVHLAMPQKLIRSFPGPAHGSPGFIKKIDTEKNSNPLIGTIVKPCTGLTLEELLKIVETTCENETLVFIKEDENLHPDFHECPLFLRAKAVQQLVDQINASRKKTKLVYAPHISGSPSRFKDYLKIALDAGVSAVMFSETYAGGLFRFAREEIAKSGQSCMIYGHNGGIGSKCRNIYREILDLLARLEGIDFRQTAPLQVKPYLRPLGLEWENSEKILQMPLEDHKPVVTVRAGGMDQGNLIPNLYDIRKKGMHHYLFLCGTAINGFLENGGYNSAKGLKAIEQTIAAFNDSGYSFKTLKGKEHVLELFQYAKIHEMNELQEILCQRYNVVS